MPAVKSMKKSKILIKILQSIIIPRYSKKILDRPKLS